ncbi:alginate lyase family protein [bacterium]|nr:MAG: alginate lyase family protein [bacterium]
MPRFMHYLKRLHELGLRGTHAWYQKRLTGKRFIQSWKEKALAGKANHTWQDLQKRHALNDIATFTNDLNKNSLVHNIINNKDFQQYLPPTYRDQAFIIQKANQALEQTFDLLGSGNQTFTIIPWQHDIKLNNLNTQEFSTYSNTYHHSAPLFYTDITIPSNATTKQHYQADIKIPWDLSRFHHAFFLGSAYQLTANQRYATAFFDQADSWITANPFLLGINWVCAMDVAIRAINLIWGYLLCQPTPQQAERLICSLYDHAIYLAANDTASDKANNHYLAELLGSLYLSVFFKSIPYFEDQIDFYTKKITQEFDKQIQQDGTSYEGSTAYHQLDTEMYLHFASITNIVKSANKTSVLTTFLAHNTTADGTLIKIGDDDSGKLVTGMSVPPTTNHISHYPNFGLSIINHNQWHITFRHPTFTKKQPSGHFHNDQLALTLSLNGIQILTDPGSYLYTANPTWRNEFRSASAHSTLFVPCLTCAANQDNLFQLARNPTSQAPELQKINATVIMHDSYQTCIHTKIIINRSLKLDTTRNELIIEDWIQTNNPSRVSWNFILHPDITLKRKDAQTWIFEKNRKPLAEITSTLILTKADAFFAPEYGVRRECHKLTTEKTILYREKTIIRYL